MPSDTVLVGLCTGLLAAVAVSASQSTLDLVDNALNIVRVAFRIGIRVNDAAQRLSTEVNQRWSRLVLDVQKEASIAEIRQFNERKVRTVSGYSPPIYPWFRDTRGSERQPGKVPVKRGRQSEAVVQIWG